MAVSNDSVALRKRAQIAKANKTMFLWVAGASVIVGFSIVVSVFLFQRLTFNERILAEKNNTLGALTYNVENMEELQNAVRALNSNEALLDLRANDTDSALQVVLDALPDNPNALALGASLQTQLIENVDGVSIDNINIEPIVIEEDWDDIDASVDDEAVDEDEELLDEEGEIGNAISFQMTVEGSIDDLRELLVNLERSIRTIHITGMRLEGTGGNEVNLTLEGYGFYEPARTLELRERVVRP